MTLQTKKLYLFDLIPLIKITQTASSLKLYVLGIKIITLKNNKILFCGIPLFSFKSFSIISKKILHYAINCPKKRNTIIILDNILSENSEPLDSFTFFEYMTQQKNSPFKVYYIINVKNSHYHKLCEKYKDKIIAYPNKHFSHLRLIMLLRKTRYILECDQKLMNLSPEIYKMLYKSKQIELIFTQHGITFFKENFISPNVYGQNAFNKIMISNDFEKEIFIRRGNYLPQNIITNGLFRWDRLLPATHNNFPKSIFVYFTYRRYLFQLSNMEKSVYIQTITNFINHPKLKQLLEDNNIELNIAQHHVISKRNISIFKNIRLISEEEIGTFKKKADLLVTDFSSMCFDFMVQDKPVVFLRIPDAEDCRRYQYSQDTAEPWSGKEHLGFNVAETVDECISKIENYVRNDFRLSANDEKTKQKFFAFPSSFCRRFYEYLEQNSNIDKE